MAAQRDKMAGLVRRQQPPPAPAPTPGNTSTQEFIKLVQNPFSSALVTNAFWTSLGTSIAFTFLLALLFSILRPHHAAVYAPRLKRASKSKGNGNGPPPVGRGFLSWLSPVLKTNQAQIQPAIGLDATIFLRFTRMCRDMFLVMSLVGCGILIPTNMTGGVKSLTQGQSPFTLMSPLLVWGRPLWGQVICAWLLDLIVAVFLWLNYRAVRQLRRAYFESPEYQARLHSRTLLINNVPKPYRTDEGVLRLSEQVTSTAGIPRAVIGREVRGLSELHRQHEKTVRRLESHLAKYLKNPHKLPPARPRCKTVKGDDAYSRREKVDAIEYLTDRMQRLEVKIKQAQANIDMRRAMGYGFASYDTAHEAHAVAYKARRSKPKGATIRLAPPPEDIIWDNLPLTKRARRWKKVGNTAWVALLTVIWVVPNGLIAIFLSNLSNLGKVWPAFRRSLEGNSRVWAAVQGIASPAILSLVYLLLPILFRRLSIRAGDTTKTSRERHVIHQLYAFFVFNNLIVFTSFSAVWQFIAVVIKESETNADILKAIKKGELGQKLVSALCMVSPFWVTWLLQRNLGAAVDLSQVWSLFWVWFAKTFMNPTPRQREEWLRPPPFDYASYYNYFLFYGTVALCFATLQPIVLPVTALYFTLDYWLKKYLLMYVFYTKTESNGQYWRVAFNRMVFATILANIVVVLVVFTRDQRNMAIAMIPPPILMLIFKFYCRWAFDDDMHYYRRHLQDSESLPHPSKRAMRNENLAARFENPAFYKPLMAPMVREDAQAVLAQIYRGRLHSESAGADLGYGRDGIRLEEFRPGKSSQVLHQQQQQQQQPQQQKMPFRFVPKSLLSDDETASMKGSTGAMMRREYGIDDMEAIRPVDLISERPDTPASSGASTYAGGRYDAYSRSSSPAPSLPMGGVGGGRPVGAGIRNGSTGDGVGVTYPTSYHHPGQHYQRSSSALSSECYVPSYTDGEDGVGYVGGGGGAGGEMYAQQNESQTGLLPGAAGMPVSSSTTHHQHSQFGYQASPPPPPPSQYRQQQQGQQQQQQGGYPLHYPSDGRYHDR